ncbi:glycosyl transferase group 1 [Mycena alexandri]|uniref:Glycosyl transferase group 1 n=1 Tax=Mycena alexandri TaxID=1745969 RepID=A0AAD6X6L8_9AGAR|nr:glycosyl transferase group 1 [Mycena alexandri]
MDDCTLLTPSPTAATASRGQISLYREPLRVAIIVENFLPQVDGSTLTIASLLQHLNAMGVQGMLFGPESGMIEYAGANLFGTFGLPMPAYPGLKVNFISPAFIHALRKFAPHVIHLVDPICLGVQALAAAALLFPSTPVVTSYHTNLAAYAAVFGYPCYPHRAWQVNAYLHSFARCTLVPSASTAKLLEERRFANLRVISRGVDISSFKSSLRSVSLREKWAATAASHSALFPETTSPGLDPVIILFVGRLSREKNLCFLIDAVAALPLCSRGRSILVFVGDGPYRRGLEERCAAAGVRAVFMGHLSGQGLGEAFASGDIMVAPSLTETSGQATLQGMAAGLAVAGLLAEGTADLVVHGHTGLLLDIVAAEEGRPWAPCMPLGPDARVLGWGEAAPLLAKNIEPLTERFACILEVLIRDEPLRCRMGRAGAQAARGGAYEWTSCSRRVVEAYGEAVGAIPLVNVKLPSQSSLLPAAIYALLDAAVVLLALGLALLSHAAYFVPTARDLRERGWWGGSGQ